MFLIYLGSFIMLSLQGLGAVDLPKDLQNAKYITVVEKNDGFGSQLKRRMSAIAFAMVHDKVYVHLPFVELQHNYDKNPDFPTIMESFANVGLGFPKKDSLENVSVYEREDYRYYTDKNIDLYYNDKVLSLLRKNYYSTPKTPIPYFNKRFVNVAVHIRRGDVGNTGPIGRWKSDEHYLAIMERIRKTYRNVRFYIYSEGKREQFLKFLREDVELRLNEEIRQTFHAMVTANILVASKSEFSCTAALLSTGVIYYTKCWIPKLSRWIEIQT